MRRFRGHTTPATKPQNVIFEELRLIFTCLYQRRRKNEDEKYKMQTMKLEGRVGSMLQSLTSNKSDCAVVVGPSQSTFAIDNKQYKVLVQLTMVRKVTNLEAHRNISPQKLFRHRTGQQQADFSLAVVKVKLGHGCTAQRSIGREGEYETLDDLLDM